MLEVGQVWVNKDIRTNTFEVLEIFGDIVKVKNTYFNDKKELIVVNVLFPSKLFLASFLELKETQLEFEF